MNETSRPALVQPMAVTNRPNPRDRLLDQVIDSTRQGGFDIDAFHVMDGRDNSLIADEVLNGAGSNKFVYSFDIMGKNVNGVSVIGARHLASIYGGLKHRIVASTQKVGSLHIFKSYPSENSRMFVQAESILSLADEDDFYEVLVEIADIKTGNTIQVEKRELAEEKRRDGSKYTRPHYQIIAQSKAFRNGILDIIPQDVVMKWKQQQLALGKNDIITDGVRDEKLSGLMQFAASKALPIDRRAAEGLTMDQIVGLQEAAKAGQGAFVNSAKALGLISQDSEADATPETKPKAQAKPAQQKASAPKEQAPEDREADDVPAHVASGPDGDLF